MLKISFTFVNVEGSIEPLDCDIQSTFADIYNYVTLATGNSFQASLSLDKVSIMANDNTPLSSLYQGGDVQVYISLTPQLMISAFLDGVQVSDASISDSITIENFVQQLLLNLNQKAAIQDYQLFSQNQELLAASPNINLQAPFSQYTAGLPQVLLNLTLQKEIPKDEEQLESLVVLDGMSLTIDPLGEFVNFKLHKPILMSGQLKKSQGKQQLKIENLNWTVHKQISYANPDQHGLVVKWNDGTYSGVQFY